jgi:molecular chaperone HtpG
MSKKQFKAESKRLLDLMINSIYTHKEIFLREIISNASDALDKLCYRALTDQNVGLSRGDFAIDIKINKDARTLTVSDNGIGMTKDELESNLGTIAQSGSLQFKQTVAADEGQDKAGGEGKEDSSIDIIGQFGVGFYSAFMVADEVRVLTRAFGSDEAWLWESEGADGYTVSSAERPAAGTDVIIKIKENAGEEDFGRFLESYTVESLIKKYSDYIRYPIRMEKEVYTPPAEGEEKGETKTEIATLNSMVPVWQRNKNELKPEDYTAFYREKFFDFEEPLTHIHVDAEGAVSYKALLFIPAKASYDYFTRDYKKGLQLYSSGVLIMDSCSDLLPEHFRFVRGVADSPDLSLNISREMLQHSRELKMIAGNIEKKIKNELNKLLNNDRDKYEKFYKVFGVQLKYGAASEFGRNKDLLQDLLMFESSNGDVLTTLDEYAARMKEDQKYIYYATGGNARRISQLPQIEALKDKGYEILYFTEEVDEFAAQMLRSFKDKEFKSANSEDLDLGEEEKKQAEEKTKESADLLTFVKETLGERVKEVRLTQKLKNHPVCLTASGGLSFEMEKYLNTVQPEGGAKADRILELNPGHRLFAKLEELLENNKEEAAKYAEVLYTQALLMAGLTLDDPASYSEVVFGLL